MRRKLEKEFVSSREWDNVAQLARAFKKEFKDHRSMATVRNYLIKTYDIKLTERIKGTTLNTRELRAIYDIVQEDKDEELTKLGRKCKEALQLDIGAAAVIRSVKEFEMLDLDKEQFNKLLEERREPKFFETQKRKPHGKFPGGCVEIVDVNDIRKGGWMLKRDYKPEFRHGKWRVGGVVKVDVSNDKRNTDWKEGKVIEEYPDFYLVQTENYKVCVDK